MGHQDTMDLRTDIELCNSAQNGSQQAFMALHGRYRDRIFRLAKAYVNDHDDAEDVTQIAFVRAHNAIAGFRGQSQFFTWLYRITLNCCKDWMKQAHLSRYDNRDDYWWSARAMDESLFGRTLKTEHLVEQREAKVLLEQALEKLRPEFRAALTLREVDGRSYREISQILSCSEGTVKSRISRARLQLRKILTPRKAAVR